jgi:hypothetical protein
MMQRRTTVQLSTIHLAHHPGSRHNFHLLRDNCCHHRISLVMRGKYLLDLIMSMGTNGTPSIYIERTDIMLLERSVKRIFGRRFLMHHKENSKWFLDLALQFPETATMMHLKTQSHSWLN